jgi:hypothetical protein
MSHEIFTSEFFVTLSDEQQQLVTGGQDFELAGSNFSQRNANLQGTTNAGPGGSDANSVGELTAINTAAQDFLGLGANEIPEVEALGNAPILNGEED